MLLINPGWVIDVPVLVLQEVQAALARCNCAAFLFSCRPRQWSTADFASPTMDPAPGSGLSGSLSSWHLVRSKCPWIASRIFLLVAESSGPRPGHRRAAKAVDRCFKFQMKNKAPSVFGQSAGLRRARSWVQWYLSPGLFQKHIRSLLSSPRRFEIKLRPCK